MCPYHMMRIILFTLVLTLFFGCEEQRIRKHNSELDERFHGKYEIISSISDVPVDLNMDGTATTDLLSENPLILSAYLEIRINDKKKRIFDNKYTKRLIDKSRKHLFEELWPVESFGYDPDTSSFLTVSYINYSEWPNIYYFDFDTETYAVTLESASSTTLEPPNTLISMEEVAVEGEELLKVVNTRKLFTYDGWKVVRIESVYRRYTTVT